MLISTSYIASAGSRAGPKEVGIYIRSLHYIYNINLGKNPLAFITISGFFRAKTL